MSVPDEVMKLKDGKIIVDKLKSMVATQFVEETANDAGAYVVYQGQVYYLPDGHTANTTWANTTKVGPTNIGEQVSRALNAIAGMVDAPVQDVQINGTSILHSGTANIPIASENEAGAVQLYGASFGLVMSQTGQLRTAPADSTNIKAGTNAYKPIAANKQHESVFYALAKLAGADMAQSSNPVGQFTPEALVAIQKMLGVYEAPWELIREDTTANETAADVDITVDGYGEPFELTDVAIELIVPAQTSAVIGNYGLVYFYHGSGSQDFVSTELGSKTITAGSSANTANAIIKQDKGLYEINFSKWTTTGNAAYVYRQPTLQTKLPIEVLSSQRIFNKVSIKSITGTIQYKIYGKRKWN